MLFDFRKYTLEKSTDGYILTLYIEESDCEFASDFSKNVISINDTLNRSIIAYIKKNLPNIKISIIKIIMGSVLILSITMTDLETSLKTTYANTKDLVKVVLDNKLIEMPQSPLVIDNITYVPIREITKELGADVKWEGEFNHVEIIKDDINLSFQIGDSNCILNSKNIYMPKSIVINNKVMVPLHFLSEVFGFDVLNQNDKYTDEDLYWLSRLVHAEAQSECYEGKLAIANVIINRTKSIDFPNSIKSVIFDKNNGVQFTSTLNGQIYLEPSQESKKAALEALEGNNNAEGILYFFNPKKSPSNWISKNRRYAFTIENHNFYF